MLLLTTILLILSGIALGLACRSWWEIGVLTLLAWSFLRLADLWTGNWRGQVGLPHDERFFEPRTMACLLGGAYVGYVLALLYSRWRLAARSKSDRRCDS
jgi:hypothetical protein